MIQVMNHYLSDFFRSGKESETTSAPLTFDEMMSTNVASSAETFHGTFNHRRQSLENHARELEPELFFLLLGLAFLTAFGIALWFYVKN